MNATVTDQIIAEAAATTPPMAPVRDEGIVSAVQAKLRELGYVDGGPATGDLGKKTEASILDFRNRNGLPLSTAIDADLLQKLGIAEPKFLPVEQTTATAAEIAPKVAAMAQTRWAKFWAKLGTIPTFLGALFMGMVQYLGDAIAMLTPLKTFLSDWLDGVDKLTLVAIAAGSTALISGVLWFNSRNAEGAMETGYRDGTVKNDNTEKKEAEAAVEREII